MDSFYRQAAGQSSWSSENQATNVSGSIVFRQHHHTFLFIKGNLLSDDLFHAAMLQSSTHFFFLSSLPNPYYFSPLKSDTFCFLSGFLRFLLNFRDYTGSHKGFPIYGISDLPYTL